jgi:hypothetical protein
MKITLLLIIGLVVGFSKINWEFPVCNLATIKQDFAPTIFFETTIDGSSQKPLVTRFFHNKVGLYGASTTKCYLNFLDPSLIYKNLGPLVLILIGFFISKSIAQKRLQLLLIFFLTPLALILNLHIVLFVIIYKIFAIIGLLLLLSKIK